MTRSQLPLGNTITLGVQDLGRERDFYRRMGWPLVLDTDNFVVFELRGAVLALFPRDLLARDAQVRAAPPNAGIASSVIIIVEQPDEVDELAARAAAAGATVTKQP